MSEGHVASWERLVNELPTGELLTNRELIEDFRRNAENKTEETIEKYVLALEEFGEWLKAPFISARPRIISDYLTYLKRDRPVVAEVRDDSVDDHYFLRPILVRRKDGPLSDSSRKGHRAAVKEFFGLLAVRYDFDRDPTMGVRAPKITLKRGLVLTRSEIRAFLAVDGRRPRCDIQAYLVVYTAGRASVFRHVVWSDVDLEAGLIHFSKVKHGRAYTLKLHPELLIRLRRWKTLQWELGTPAVQQALLNPATAYVLLTRNGRQLSHSTLAKQIKWRAADAGIRLHPEGAKVGKENRSLCSPHAFRRSWATIRLEDGEALDAIAEVLNHKELSTTKNHYAFGSDERRRRAVVEFSL